MNQPNPANGFAAHLARSAGKFKKAVTEFSAHEVKARGKAETARGWERLRKNDRIAAMERVMVNNFKAHDLGPRAGVGGPGAMTPELAHHLMVSQANGREAFVRNTNEFVEEYAEAKRDAMKAVKSDSELGEDWLEKVETFTEIGAKMSRFVTDQAAEEKNEWMRVLPSGQRITMDAAEMGEISQRVVVLFSGKVVDLQNKIFNEVSYRYDPALDFDANQDALYRAKDELDALVELADSLKPHFRDFGNVIVAVSEHVQQLIDDEGWKVWAEKNSKSGKIDWAISGVDFVLTGLASGLRELPFHGAGAVGSVAAAGIGQLTGALHKAARDARIKEAKKERAPGGVVNDKALRKVYLEAMDADKSMMAARVFQIQRENLEAAWTVIGIGLSEIPVPLVGSAIKTFCQGVTVGYYKTRLENLREQLAPVEPEMGEQAEELVNRYLVEPAVDAIKEVVVTDWKNECAKLGKEVWEKAGEMGAAVADFFREEFKDIGSLAKDALKEGLVAFVTNVAAALAARMIAWIATTAIAPAISGGDLRQILDRMRDVKQDVDLALATI